MLPHDWVPVLEPIILAFNALGVPYQIGGSLASSAWGLPRSTQDADLVAGILLQHVDPFVARLQNDYYIDASMIRDAIVRQSNFNLLHLSTMLKVDIFVRDLTAFDVATFQRARPQWLDEQKSEQAVFTSPEDIILHKLRWYESGGAVSERQWLDVLGVLKVQAGDLDIPYLREWARKLGIAELLARAWGEAGLP